MNSYKLSVKEWVEKTHAIGLKASADLPNPSLLPAPCVRRTYLLLPHLIRNRAEPILPILAHHPVKV